MSATIKTDKIVGTSVSDRWSITPVEYEMTVTAMDGTVTNERVDFQDLMVGVAEQRAVTLEEQVKPLAKRVEARNKKLQQIGFALSQLSNVSAQFNSENPNPSVSGVKFDPDTFAIIAEVYKISNSKLPDDLNKDKFGGTVWKSSVDEATQKLKSWSERLNNESQLNTSRLQRLVDNRDQSYNTGTTMMNHISDTRGFVIKSMT